MNYGWIVPTIAVIVYLLIAKWFLTTKKGGR